MATYTELINYFKANVPQVAHLEGTPAYGDAFNKWTLDIMTDLGVDGWDAIPMAELANYDYVGDPATGTTTAGPTTTTGPAEQQIFNKVAPILTKQIDDDTARAAEAERWSAQTRTAYGNFGDVLGQTTMRFDGAGYLQANPDLAAEYQKQLADGSLPKDPNGNPLTPDAWAKLHYDTYGKNEGRKGGAMTSGLLDMQRTNVDSTVQSVIDASRISAGEQQGGLATSINTQRGAIDKLTGEQLANLEQSIATQQAALAKEVESLRGNATAAAQSRRAALEQQLAQLTAAQAPVAAARIKAAEAEVTGINLGLESTRDQISADAAREGFYGPSTMTESALGRASIDAYQNAARTRGVADVTNATETRSIGNYGANQGYSITDVLAGDTQRVGDYGATGTARLTATGAEVGRGIRDQGATGNAQLTGWGAEQGRGITTTASREEQAARAAGAGQKSAYFDQLYPNAVNSAQVMTQLPAAQAGALTSIIPYSTAGTNNALNTLNWWNTGPVNPPGTTTVMTNPSNAGNQVGQLGVGLVGAGFQMANSSNWWQPSTTNPASTNAATTSRSGTTGLQKKKNPWES